MVESVQSTYLQDLAKKADEAASNVDRFMSEKNNTPNSYIGRYANSGRKMVIEDYGSNGDTAGDGVTSEEDSKRDEDATYTQAKATTKEARTIIGRMVSASPSPSLGSNNSNSGRVSGLLGEIFKRNGHGGVQVGNTRGNVVPNEIGSSNESDEDKEIIQDEIEATSAATLALDQQEKKYAKKKRARNKCILSEKRKLIKQGRKMRLISNRK